MSALASQIDVESLAKTLSWDEFSRTIGDLVLSKYKNDLLLVYLKICATTNAIFPGHNRRMVNIDFLALQTAVALFAIGAIVQEKNLTSKVMAGVVAYIQNNTFLKKNSVYAEAYKNRVYDLTENGKLAENFCKHYGLEMLENRKVLMKLVMYLSVSKSAYVQVFKGWKITD